jgi:hypothetical protein
MGILAGFLASMFGMLVSWFSYWMAKKVAVALAAISAFSVLTVALFAALSLLVNSLLVVFPGEVLSTFIWLAVPDTVAPTIAAVIACDTAIAVYQWNTANVRMAYQAQ